MSDTEKTNTSSDANVRMQTLLASFRQIGMPLLQALVEVSGHKGEDVASPEAVAASSEKFGALVDCTVLLSRELTKEIGANEGDLDAAVRWALAGSASQVVAASFHASGELMKPEEATRLAHIAAQLQEKFKSQLPAEAEPPPNTVATFRAKMMEALVPVVGAVAQYSFNRAEHELLGEIAERLVKMADQITRALALPGCTPEQWRFLCWNVLRASGQIYAESHYAEADRLQDMEPEERARYFAQHGDQVPMTQVWQAFNQRMAMLATLSTYLEVPATARLDEQGW